MRNTTSSNNFQESSPKTSETVPISQNSTRKVYFRLIPAHRTHYLHSGLHLATCTNLISPKQKKRKHPPHILTRVQVCGEQ